MRVLESKDGVISSSLCGEIKLAAHRAVGTENVSAVRYGRRYYTVEKGMMAWVPDDPSTFISIDVADCKRKFPERANASSQPLGANVST